MEGGSAVVPPAVVASTTGAAAPPHGAVVVYYRCPCHSDPAHSLNTVAVCKMFLSIVSNTQAANSL